MTLFPIKLKVRLIERYSTNNNVDVRYWYIKTLAQVISLEMFIEFT